ncbi:MAG: porin [Pseudomonadota bacterium]
MMKKILAVALASAFAAPAFADTANVNVYGVINVGVESVDNGAERKSRVTTGNNAAIGFKGSEDLGGGMKANWQVETNLSIDGDGNVATANAGNGALNGTRNVWGGLSGGWGEVRIGVHDTPYKMSTGRLDSFVATLGDYNTLLGAGDGANASGLFDLRTGNTIAYISPNLSGFQLAGAYVMSSENGVAAGADNGKAYSLSATYTAGPLFVTAAYEDHKLYPTGATGASTSGGVVILNNGAAPSNDRDAWKIGAGYKFGDLEVGAIYEKIDLGTNNDWSTWFLKADYTMGAIKLKAAYAKADESASGANNGAKHFALGADYSFSKRTMLQFTYSKVDNDGTAAAGGNWVLSQGTNTVGTTTSVAGTDASGYGVQMVHRF